MPLNVIHVSSLSLNGSWFEKLVLILEQRSFSQKLITLSSAKVNFDTGNPKNLKVYSPRQTARLLRYFEVFVLIHKCMSKDRANLLFAQGHVESIICALSAKILGIEYGLIHHIQPAFFTELMHRKRIRAFIHYQLYKYYIRHAVMIQSLSTDVTDSITKLGVRSSRIIRLAHGTNFDEFAGKITHSNISMETVTRFPTLLMVGRLSWEKNYYLALESFKKLCVEFADAKLVIAGIGPMDAELKRFVDRNGMGNQVEFLGFVSNIPNLMINADALLHLSLTESYGQIYLEASLVDLPIITYKVGIAEELMEMDNSRITILDSFEPNDVAKVIATICKDTLWGRKKAEFNPQLFAKHDEKYVLRKIGDYLENYGDRTK
jgi:glycosyltransferase involved in cell wall biosynthesis